jgi:uncharacterized protein YggE
MRRWLATGAIGLVLAMPAWCVQQQAGSAASGRPSVAGKGEGAQKAEIARLESDVARQESDSRKASERLQRQDQAIAELQRQLQQLKAAGAGNKP